MIVAPGLTSAANATGGDKGTSSARTTGDGAGGATTAGAQSRTTEGEGTDDEEDTDVGAAKRELVRTHSLGSIDAWGVYVRDEQATNPLFNDKRRSTCLPGRSFLQRTIHLEP